MSTVGSIETGEMPVSLIRLTFVSCWSQLHFVLTPFSRRRSMAASNSARNAEKLGQNVNSRSPSWNAPRMRSKSR